MPYNRLSRSLPLLLAFVLVLGSCEQVREAVPGGKEEPPKVAEANFEVGEVWTIDPQDRPDSGQKAQDSAAKVVTMLNTYYTNAFLDPARWRNGQHNDLALLFTGEAQPSVGPNLPHLAVAELWDKLESVEPTTQRLDKVSFTVEPDGSLPIGVASVTFEATAKAVDGDDVPIKHQATYYLQREGEEYKISAYSTTLNAGGAPQ